MTGRNQQNPLRAAIMILLASALIAATTLLAKALGQGIGGEPMHPFSVVAGRYGFALMILIIVYAIRRPKIQNPSYSTHFARTFTGAIGVTLMFTAVARIPVSDATAISFLNPVVAMVLAIPLLGERVGPIRWLAAVIALIGAVILLRPGIGSIQPGAFFALAAAVFMGMEIVVIKKLAGREAPLQILIINNTMGAILAITAAAFIWVPPTPLQWLMMAGIGAIMVSAQSLYIQAMRNADASFVVPFSYATLVFATLYDMFLFSSRPDAISVLGGATILFGAVLLAWREARHKKLQRNV